MLCVCMSRKKLRVFGGCAACIQFVICVYTAILRVPVGIKFFINFKTLYTHVKLLSAVCLNFSASRASIYVVASREMAFLCRNTQNSACISLVRYMLLVILLCNKSILLLFFPVSVFNFCLLIKVTTVIKKILTLYTILITFGSALLILSNFHRESSR